MIAAIDYQREEVYIANIVKCRPPNNRTPEPDEVRACQPYLERQVQLIRPQVICTLGSPATKALIPTVRSITAARGKLFQFAGRPLIPTFHPAYLLRNPSAKREAWIDLQQVAELAREQDA
jgi:DNA polymerase